MHQLKWHSIAVLAEKRNEVDVKLGAAVVNLDMVVRKLTDLRFSASPGMLLPSLFGIDQPLALDLKAVRVIWVRDLVLLSFSAYET